MFSSQSCFGIYLIQWFSVGAGERSERRGQKDVLSQKDAFLTLTLTGVEYSFNEWSPEGLNFRQCIGKLLTTVWCLTQSFSNTSKRMCSFNIFFLFYFLFIFCFIGVQLQLSHIFPHFSPLPHPACHPAHLHVESNQPNKQRRQTVPETWKWGTNWQWPEGRRQGENRKEGEGVSQGTCTEVLNMI